MERVGRGKRKSRRSDRFSHSWGRRSHRLTGRPDDLSRFFEVTEQDQARLIAERVARRVAAIRSSASASGSSNAPSSNGGPVREELSAIRAGLHDLESKLDRIESTI